MRGDRTLVPLGLVGDQSKKKDFGIGLNLRLLSQLEKKRIPFDAGPKRCYNNIDRNTEPILILGRLPRSLFPLWTPTFSSCLSVGLERQTKLSIRQIILLERTYAILW